jgi:hypothetical protein
MGFHSYLYFDRVTCRRAPQKVDLWLQLPQGTAWEVAASRGFWHRDGQEVLTAIDILNI